MTAPTAPEERYEALVAALVGAPGVTPPDSAGPKRFGSTSLKINNKMFAMLARGRLVLKLPRHRVDELVASGTGERWDPGKGQPQKEWLSVDLSSDDDWLPLATEAMDFVGHPPKRR